MDLSKVFYFLSAIACVIGVNVYGTANDSNKNIGPGRRIMGGSSASSEAPTSTKPNNRATFAGSGPGSDADQQPPPAPSNEILGSDGKLSVPTSPKQN